VLNPPPGFWLRFPVRARSDSR
jgi:hypothetical protein